MPKKAACPNENIPAYPPMMFQATPIMANRNTMIMMCSGNEPLTNRGYSKRRISTSADTEICLRVGVRMLTTPRGPAAGSRP